LENVDIFYGHLEYFMAIWDILWPFGTFCLATLGCTRKIYCQSDSFVSVQAKLAAQFPIS
jgi:hypothetical protein